MSEPAEKSTLAGVAPASIAAPVGHLAIRGVVWSTLLSIGTKVISVVQQFIIARFFLSDADFGLVAMTQVVIMLAAVGQNLGLSEIMARRHRTFDRWAQAAIWLSLAGAIFCIAVILCILPFWDRLYGLVSSLLNGHAHATPQIQGLLVIWCLGLPFDAMATIFNARLRADMQFRAWAVIASTQTIGVAALSIILALFKFKAYALVIPLPIMMFVTFMLSRHFSGQRVRLRPQFRRWGPLLRDARYFFVGNEFNVFLQQGDYLVTGLFFSQAVLGAYFFAFRMSSQTGQLISANLNTVLLPSFARLDQERPRQLAAYERTCSSLLFVGVPLCCLQALLAQPLFGFLFHGKWDLAWPLFETLSLALGFAIPMSTALSLLVAQGRLRLSMMLTVAQAALFVTFVLCGAMCGSVNWIANFVALFYLIFGPLTVALPVAGSGGSVWQFLFRVYAFPVVAAAAATDAGYLISNQLNLHSDLLTILVRSAAWLAVMALLVLLMRPPAVQELGPRLAAMLARLLPRRKAA